VSNNRSYYYRKAQQKARKEDTHPDTGNKGFFSKLPKIRIVGGFNFNKLQDWQKLVIAAVLTLSITTVGGLAYNYYANPAFRASIARVTGFNIGGSDSAASVNRLRNLLTRTDNSEDFYKRYTLGQLNIYPDAWVNRNFNPSERVNTLISSPESDPDGDGLTNKEEYFYGSNPKKSRSLCEGFSTGQKPVPTSPFECDQRSDKQLVTDGLSPLSGLELEVASSFTVLNQDIGIINNLKESFEKAANEGVDFPVLYQESRLIDLSAQASSIKFTTVEDNAVSITNYRLARAEALQSFSGQGGLSDLSQIYQVTKIEQLENLKNQYATQYSTLEKMQVPKRYDQAHRAYMMIFAKLKELIGLRQQALKDNKLSDPEYQRQGKVKSVEVFWGYRRLQEEQARLKE
jgi:Bacterial TSP3 repeat